ncbi:flavodoxin domain-containing protein [Corynebacterium epidermidicanis]|uniref:Flavodoxin domain n=1 Tax=Corynebacterium epidermidicanis TaxID=1050174 RepID=A0A0G3GNG6_9CORY|nr:flavodoxin domain-containing protein [Corynebacterium epidermidicanis]AKK02751.1 Flavodoxin domain [Corynebacterium epidermidicanis]
MSVVVAFHSFYGSSKEYAEEFARRHNVSAHPLDDAPEALIADPQSPLVIFAANHAGMNAGAKFFSEHLTELDGRRLALATVGMTLLDDVRASDPMARTLGDAKDAVQRFYLPGRMNYSELSKVHKATMWTMHQMLKAKKTRTANEQAMFDDYDRDVSRMDFAELDAIDQWLADGA